MHPLDASRDAGYFRHAPSEISVSRLMSGSQVGLIEVEARELSNW